MLFLEGNAPHFSQLLLFSKHQNELFWALMLEKAKSHKGLVMHQPILKGNLSMVIIYIFKISFFNFNFKIVRSTSHAVKNFTDFPCRRDQPSPMNGSIISKR